MRFLCRALGNLSTRLGRRSTASLFQSALWVRQDKILLNRRPIPPSLDYHRYSGGMKKDESQHFFRCPNEDLLGF